MLVGKIINGRFYRAEEISHLPVEENRSAYVINDEIPRTLNHADCRYYTSKRAFRAATKAAGCVEVGDQYLSLVSAHEKRKEELRRTKRGNPERIELIKRVMEGNYHAED